MSDVPKFVWQKRAQQPAGEHPDANVLSAFAEDALSKRERAQVVTHLSACDACRETVALALPEVPGAVPESAPVVSLWARWPMLRWAGVTAAVVVVAAAVVVENARRPESKAQLMRTESVAKQAEPKQPEAVSDQPTTAGVRQDRERKQADLTAPAKATPPAGTRRAFENADAHQQPTLPSTGAGAPAGEFSLRTTPLRAKAENVPAEKKDAAAAGVVTSLNGTVGAQSNELARPPVPATAAAMAAPSARPHSTSEAVAAAPGAAGGAATDQANRQQVMVTPPQAANAVRVDEFGQAEVVSEQQAKAHAGKPLVMGGPVGGPLPGPALAKTAYSTSAPRWRISAEGAVERSLDAGQSWQRIAVAGARDTFRSVAVVENDIWAGGVRGALYHSSDNGRTWRRVPVKADAEALEADIARVEFTDAQHGSVITTVGETWSTGDGGATWSAGRR